MQVKFIAEVSSNHNGNIDRCFDFIESAKDSGFDAVKFQLFQIDQLFSPEVIAKREDIRKRRQWQLPLDFIPLLSEKCKQMNIEFGCTPFYIEAVDQLQPYVDFYKIASYELLWGDLIKRCCLTNKPIMISTGMADLKEIGHAMEIVKGSDVNDVTLLHCVSNYPTAPENCNLAAIETLRQQFQCDVGWSDHSVKESVMYRAAYKWQASVIELHLDLDGEGEEYKGGHCWLPKDIAAVIDDIRNDLNIDKAAVSADGDGIKEPLENELFERQWRADPEDGLRPLLATRKDLK